MFFSLVNAMSSLSEEVIKIFIIIIAMCHVFLDYFI